MTIKGIIDEDFVNYKKPAMVIEFPYCDFKCDKECGEPICQNSSLVNEPNINISYEDIIKRYLANPITEAIVCQGLEPFDSMFDVISLILVLRGQYHCDDDFVIYTGYTKEELIRNRETPQSLAQFENIIIKYGRYIPGQAPHYDEVLGVKLASDNQYAERL